MIDRARLAACYALEQRRFEERHPNSRALFERARVRMAGDTVIEGAAGMLAVWQAHVRIDP